MSNSKLTKKLEKLPDSPGVYFHKAKNGEIIYIGKAAVLKNRVRQYFQSSKMFDNKTLALVNEIADVSWIETDSEVDALFLESEMIKRYMPRYNVLLRDDKSQTYVRIDMKSDWPVVSFTRNPLDDGAEYFGPFYNSFALKKALRYLRRVFPYLTKKNSRSRLDEDMGLSPKKSDGSAVYKANLRKLISYIKGNRQKLIKDLKREMKLASDQQDFEMAAKLRDKIGYLKELQRRVCFGDEEFLNISKDLALRDLADLFGLKEPPRRIEGYDISHMSGTNVVASMVVFQNGVSSRADYRKFKTRAEKNNDFDNMYEAVWRRLSERNIKSWGLADLMVIDGGKGQLEVAIKARDERKVSVPMIGLVERSERIIVGRNSNVEVDKEQVKTLGGRLEYSDNFLVIDLPKNSHIIKLLQRIRDESHRFAVSYHTILKRKSQTKNLLEEIPGIGPKTRARLMKRFGSLTKIKQATLTELTEVAGPAKAKILTNFFADK